jgi:hypothetical protein
MPNAFNGLAGSSGSEPSRQAIICPLVRPGLESRPLFRKQGFVYNAILDRPDLVHMKPFVILSRGR